MGDVHYRIRWARGELSGKVGRTRMCHAEKRVRFLGLFWLWWPLENANWRSNEAEAQRDIEDDVWLSAPLPASTFQTKTEAPR